MSPALPLLLGLMALGAGLLGLGYYLEHKDTLR